MPSNCYYKIYISIRGSGNADTITVTITDTSDNVFSLFKTKSISANGTNRITISLVLEEVRY